MRSLKLGLAATAMIWALSATAQAADCVRVAVAGESLTHDVAVLFSTNGLKNIIYGQGRRFASDEVHRVVPHWLRSRPRLAPSPRSKMRSASGHEADPAAFAQGHVLARLRESRQRNNFGS